MQMSLEALRFQDNKEKLMLIVSRYRFALYLSYVRSQVLFDYLGK